MTELTTTAQSIKDFIMDQFLAGEDPDELQNDTDLIGGGIMDSLATLKLVNFLEETFNVSIEPIDMNQDNLRSISTIESLVSSKL